MLESSAQGGRVKARRDRLQVTRMAQKAADVVRRSTYHGVWIATRDMLNEMTNMRVEGEKEDDGRERVHP